MARATPVSASWLISYFTRHRTAANLLLVVMIVLGAISIPNLRAQFLPQVVVNSITVTTTWEGASAEDIDEGIVQLLNPALLTVDGVEESFSTSVEGRSFVWLEFEPGWDMSRAAEDVLSTVNAVTDLPEEADEPVVTRDAWRDRVTDVVISGLVDAEQLANLADELVLRLFDVGVTRTTIQGVAAPLTTVEVPSVNLLAHDISIADIARAVNAQVEASPAGDLDGSNLRVRTGTRDRDAASIEDIVLRSNQDGTNLTVGDVAFVTVESVSRNEQYFIDDDPTMVIRVDRSAAGDALEVQAVVEDTIAEMASTAPEGIRIELARTRSAVISDRLNLLVDNGLVGLGLVLLLLFLFLNARTAFWVAAGIPVAIMGAISAMYLLGLTINMISLFALIITLGIIVDDAIVVGEHADARARKLREVPEEAAERAAHRMALPVFCAALTTMIAFFGLVFIGGEFGDFISDIPWTVVAVLIASLIECFFILPHHMSQAIAKSAKERWYDLPSKYVNQGFVWFRDTAFRPFMRWVITFRYPVLAAVIALLIGQITMIISRDVSWRFFAAPEISHINGSFSMVSGTDRDDTNDMTREIQRATEVVAAQYEEKYGRNPVILAIAEAGGSPSGRGGRVSVKSPDELGGISIELIDADARPYSSSAFARDLEDEVQRHAKVETLSFRSVFGGPGRDSLEIELYGASSETLKQASEAVQAELTRFSDVTGVQDNLSYDKEELVLTLTPQGQALGFSIDELGRVVRHRLSGMEAATYPDGRRSAEIRVELPSREATADFIERTQLRAPSGVYVPLADIVNVDRRTGFATVRRENGARVLDINGQIDDGDADRAIEIIETIEDTILPQIEATYQVESRVTGLVLQEREFLSDAQFAWILTIIGIYTVLAWVFASWTRPAVVMAVIPFGLTGAIYGHYMWDVPLSMFTIIGLLGVTGIIINDSIVLVSTIDEHAKERGIYQAIVEGAADRLRPVILTTLTTVLGLTPLLFEGSQAAEFLKPSVITLVYGLGFGMVLVLMLVPALIAIQHDLSRRRTALRRALAARTGAIRWPVMVSLGAVVAWLGATLGATAVTGALPAWLYQMAGPMADWSPMAAALALYAVGVLVLITACAAMVLIAHSRAQPAGQP
ncbi:MAG: efflux RND transporter permease subunit [Pseudomonadota bacterium]